VDVKPEEKVMLQALYEIFAMNYEKIHRLRKEQNKFF
jgi:hypothetical protein